MVLLSAFAHWRHLHLSLRLWPKVVRKVHCATDLRMFQMSILVPFFPWMESSCSCSSDSLWKREYFRMALRLASESSVTTSVCEMGVKGHALTDANVRLRVCMHRVQNMQNKSMHLIFSLELHTEKCLTSRILGWEIRSGLYELKDIGLLVEGGDGHDHGLSFNSL